MVELNPEFGPVPVPVNVSVPLPVPLETPAMLKITVPLDDRVVEPTGVIELMPAGGEGGDTVTDPKPGAMDTEMDTWVVVPLKTEREAGSPLIVKPGSALMDPLLADAVKPPDTAFALSANVEPLNPVFTDTEKVTDVTLVTFTVALAGLNVTAPVGLVDGVSKTVPENPEAG